MSMPYLKKLASRITGLEISAQATAAGEALVTAGMAPYEETTRGGSGFHCTATTPTAAVVALPTTAAGISIWNADADDGKSIIIDAIYAINAVGHAVLGQSGLICVVGQTDVASNSGTLVVRKNNGNGPAKGSIALVAPGSTALDAVTGVAIGWIPMGNSVNLSVVSLPGLILWAPVNGRIIVPPARLFGVNVISANVENTWNCGIMWHEKQLTLG